MAFRFLSRIVVREYVRLRASIGQFLDERPGRELKSSSSGNRSPVQDGRQKVDRLRGALEQLDPLTCNVFIDHCADKLSYDDIASRHDITTDEVEIRIAEALYLILRMTE